MPLDIVMSAKEKRDRRKVLLSCREAQLVSHGARVSKNDGEDQ